MHNKQWSKVKKKLESYICHCLKNRVDFYLTNYRRTHDQTGRAFIIVDNKEVLNMCSIIAEKAVVKKEDEIRNTQNIRYDVDNYEQNRDIQRQAAELVMAEGIFAQYDFFDAVEEFLRLPIELALKSDNMVIKILSLIDRRVGKRTLQKIKESIHEEKDIVQYFFQLRYEAEGLKKKYLYARD
ncbi:MULTISPECIES: SF0329 family protein [Niallia]|uniref:SF0329 family protein n=1 Tax=Niallia TaxID=2837506 RepID=UPI00119EE41A